MIFINIFATNLSSSKITHVYTFVIINLLLFFQINFNMKLPKFLTIQKPNNRLFSVSGFAAALKPNNFDGKKAYQDGIVVDCDELLSCRTGEA